MDSAEQRTIPASAPADLLQMRNISKSFSGVRVLSDVDFDLRRGEVHVLAGENGAGKSTLIKILAGVHRDFEGGIRLRDSPVRFRSPHDATARGIAVIHQELSLVGSMSVANNLFLGREKVLGGFWVDRSGELKAAHAFLSGVGISIDPGRIVDEYPLAIRQMLEIARALSLQADVLVMDEPTSTLSDAEVERLFGAIRGLTARGCGVIYISHKLEEIYRIGDRITVLRDGKNAGTALASGLPREELIRRMVGRELDTQFPYRKIPRGEELLCLDGVSVAGGESKGVLTVDAISLRLFGSEVVGLAGLQGCGNSELLQAVFGASPGLVRGRIRINGGETEFLTPRWSIAQHIALLTNDRKSNGLIMEMSIIHNATLPSLRRFSAQGWIRKSREEQAAGKQAGVLHLKAESLRQDVGTLSGGNQQKVVFAKWLETRPRILLLDDPTRGIDVGAKQEIYDLIQRLKEEGCGILLVSSEMSELLGLSDRILVMRNGRIVREFGRAEATQEKVLRAALAAGEEAHV